MGVVVDLHWCLLYFIISITSLIVFIDGALKGSYNFLKFFLKQFLQPLKKEKTVFCE